MKYWRWIRKNLDWILPSIAIVLMVVVYTVLQGIITSQHDSNIGSCERGNESRLATVKNLKADRENLRADRDFLQSAISPSPSRVALVSQKNATVVKKTAAIKGLIESQSSVAIEPGSPVVDCAKAFP